MQIYVKQFCTNFKYHSFLGFSPSEKFRIFETEFWVVSWHTFPCQLASQHDVGQHKEGVEGGALAKPLNP